VKALLLALSLLDGFDHVSDWTVIRSDGVQASVVSAEGCSGRGLRLDYDFGGGSGYAVARRALVLPLPPSWAFSFCLRAEGAPNDLEFKLVDASGANVWWWRRKALAPSDGFERVRVKKRQVSFAWGPAGAGAALKEVAALEIAVVAGAGGKGSLFLDELAFEELPLPGPLPPPRVSSSDRESNVDFGGARELGGLAVTFDEARLPRDFRVEASLDGSSWRLVREVKGNGRRTSWMAFPELEARYLRLSTPSVSNVEPMPPSFGESRDTLVLEMARREPRGRYPRGFSGEQTYWTVAGVDGDAEEVLVGEDGALEPGKGTFSLEPLVYANGALLDWSRVTTTQSLAEGYLPIPTVTWTAGTLSLSITALVDSSGLSARYRLSNHASQAAAARLLVAIRPFLVNPPSQFLNAPHGVSPITRLAFDGRAAAVDGRSVVPLPAPSAFGATAFDSGDLVELLAGGRLPPAASVEDPTGLASGAFAWDLELPAGAWRDVDLVVPLGKDDTRSPADGFEHRLAAAVRSWKAKLDRVTFRVPPDAEPLVATLRSNVGYVLINRDGPRIQPGSRAYERSWIRDGALTSSALLRLGHADVVHDFLVWFAGHQFASGKVPCCVDARGADPVPENDSHGELLFLAGEYRRFTHDDATIRTLWPRLEMTVAYIDALRKQRRTPEYQAPDKRAFYGLLPESISHEGYSDKPVHSYWDDFFALKGLKDAVELAQALGQEAQATAWRAIRDEFRADLLASVRATIAANGLDTIPASVERHDFDPTSTTTVLSPAGEQDGLPQAELRRTFERYLQESRVRRDGKTDYGYTPYELRTVGALVRLGLVAEAHEMLAFFLKDRRPAGWNQWAEAIGSDVRAPRFVGDMPHTWVGTDFIRSFLDLFAYERERDRTLVLGGGLPEAWVRAPGGAGVSGLHTQYGLLELTVGTRGDELRARVAGIALPPGGIALRWPLAGAPRVATVNGKPAEIRGGEVLVREVPAEVVARR